MNKKRIKGIITLVVIAAIVAGLVLGLRACVSAQTSVSGVTSVEAQPLQEQDLSTYVSAVGTVKSQSVVDVTTELTAKLKELDVALGDRVTEGQVLCVFDSSDIQQQINELESQLSSSKAVAAKQQEIAQRNLSQAKTAQTETLDRDTAAVAAAQKALAAAQAAYDADSAAGADAAALASDAEAVQSAQSALTAAQATYASDKQTTAEAIQSAQDNVDTTSLSTGTDNTTATTLSKLYRQLDAVTVTAPQAGIITSLNISEGGVANGVLMEIQDPDNLQVSLTISEKDILKLSTGLSAVITSDALGDKSIGGSVTRVINFAAGSSGTTSGLTSALSTSTGSSSSSSYSADVAVDSGSGLLLGMSVKVKIIVQSAPRQQAVAYDSVTTDENGKSYVYKAEPQSGGNYLVKKVSVTTGLQSDYYVAITSSELQTGDYIISDPTSVTEGETVALTNVTAAISDGLTGTAQ